MTEIESSEDLRGEWAQLGIKAGDVAPLGQYIYESRSNNGIDTSQLAVGFYGFWTFFPGVCNRGSGSSKDQLEGCPNNPCVNLQVVAGDDCELDVLFSLCVRVNYFWRRIQCGSSTHPFATLQVPTSARASAIARRNAALAAAPNPAGTAAR